MDSVETAVRTINLPLLKPVTVHLFIHPLEFMRRQADILHFRSVGVKAKSVVSFNDFYPDNCTIPDFICVLYHILRLSRCILLRHQIMRIIFLR